tara:strand:+ start:3342 stop:4520 length:1179 start_codon:yes stop_codon:yes gene_type:complete
MSEFNKTMTDGKFNDYHAVTKPQIKSTRDQLKGELITEENDISKVNAEIGKNDANQKPVQNTWNAHNSRAASYNSKADWAAGKAKRSWWSRSYYKRIRENNRRAASSEYGKRDAQTPTLNKHKGIDTTLQGELKIEEKQKQEVDDKTTVNTRADATLVKQKDFYDNREEECKRNEQRITDYESNLTKLKQELDELKKNLDGCNRTYYTKCSKESRDKLLQKVKERENEMNFLKSKQDEYLKVCNNGPINCNELFKIYQTAFQVHKENHEHKLNLNEKHNVCVDPYRNNCKEKYGELKSSELKTKTQAKILKESFMESMESYEKHEQIVADHNQNKQNLKPMQAVVKELTDGNNISNSSIYASQKKKYDETILTNILLTALASSLLYYTFIEL